jgi:Cdc6-like AAA superfamily ATPase
MNNSQFLETHFIDYLKKRKEKNLHPKLDCILSKIPKIPNSNLIIYGPPGVGKYTYSLAILEMQSEKKLNYERKLSVCFNKEEYYYKISDIHFEIDMELLGCNAKLLWNEIYNQIEDVISSKSNGYGVILCKNFHKIHSELLDNFYSYMQRKKNNNKIFFYLITECISFIPNNIISTCYQVVIPRPTISQYNKVISKNINSKNIKNITNLKELQISSTINNKYLNYCNILYSKIINMNQISLMEIRELIYDMLIYNFDTYQVIYNLLTILSENKKIDKNSLSIILNDINDFYKNYNNNYRPIYHLEILLFKIISIIS